MGFSFSSKTSRAEFILFSPALTCMARRRLEEAVNTARELNEKLELMKPEQSLQHPQHVPLHRDSYGIYSLQFSHSVRKLAVGFGNGAVQVLRVPEGTPQADLCLGHPKRQAVTCMAFHPKNMDLLVAASADGSVNVYNSETSECILSFTEEGNEINGLDFCLDGSVYATCGKDKNIRVYDSQTNQMVHMYEAPDISCEDISLTSGHSRRIFALKFHPEELHYFVTGGWDNSLKIWDKRITSSARKLIIGPHICGPGIDIKGNKVLTASWVAQNSLQLWDFGSCKQEKQIPIPSEPQQGEFLYAAQFCSRDIVIAGGSGTNTAHVINYKTDQVLGNVPIGKAVQALDTALGGKHIAVAGVGGNLHLTSLV
ncbi:GATOR2 complex protein WDR24-like isoform X2 [Petromyzon marinus]|uniref:GATOR2 complex protein WDR24-like isoform X2 n=1 Tax=Petromyzon marinus TaxID=7757 RepID=UPI003F6F9E49